MGVGCNYREEILDGAVLAALAVERRQGTYFVLLLQFFAILLREIRHLIDALGLFLVEPLGYLLRRKGGHTKTADDAFQFRQCHSQ